jgi:hypothetical protein
MQQQQHHHNNHTSNNNNNTRSARPVLLPNAVLAAAHGFSLPDRQTVAPIDLVCDIVQHPRVSSNSGFDVLWMPDAVRMPRHVRAVLDAANEEDVLRAEIARANEMVGEMAGAASAAGSPGREHRMRLVKRGATPTSPSSSSPKHGPSAAAPLRPPPLTRDISEATGGVSAAAAAAAASSDATAATATTSIAAASAAASASAPPSRSRRIVGFDDGLVGADAVFRGFPGLVLPSSQQATTPRRQL